ncbi:hypothetical protein LVY75_18790 [Sinorhizobium sp. B11]
MSGTVHEFTGGEATNPSERVAKFIALAREIEALVSNDEWNLDIWQVGSSFVTKGQNRDSRVLAYYNRDTTLTNRQEVVGGAPLLGQFREFAKAYVRYHHSTSPVLFEPTVKRLRALQLIEASFRCLNLEPRIESLNVSVLNAAVALAQEGVGPGRHYQFAVTIQKVYRFCIDRKFLHAPFQWKHGVRKPKEKTEEIGKEAREWREQKLPSPEAFLALAHIYRNSEGFVDRLYSAITAIFVSIPIRIHEVLQLREDCEVYDKVKDPATGDTSDTYGIRVFPGKGHPPQVKWVPTLMASLVQEAVARIREMCAEARLVAAWYEKNPGQLWLPGDLEKFRSSDWLPKDGLVRLMDIRPAKDAARWLNVQGVEWRSDGKTPFMKEARISSLAAVHLKDLPGDFPHLNRYDDQRYSETLLVLFGNQAHSDKRTYRTLIEKGTVQSYDHWLSGHDGGRKPSVFERFGYTESDGSPIKISSHAFRHWLNTVAQLKGMSDLDIAKWSGREVPQNKAYNHVTPEETLSQIRAALDDGTGNGPMFEEGKMVGINRPVDRREFAEARIGAALTTELGICVHDYSLLPCETHGHCIDCSENVFIKGDVKHQERVSKRLVLSAKQLDDAIRAMGEGHVGADRWVRSHEASIAKMRLMLSMHDDPSIPDGTVMSLPGASRDGEVAMALRDRDVNERSSRAGSVDDDLVDALVDMWED